MGTTTSKRHRLVVMIAALALLLGLSACADIDTVLKINNDGSGVRTITGTVTADDLKEAKGGVPAIEKVIKANVPKDMTYAGKAAGKEPNSTVFTFTIAFKDEAEYKKKVTSILAAGDFSREVTATVKAYDSPLKKGVEVEENFTSEDLMAWLPPALVKAKVLEESNKEFMSLGKTTVQFDGETYQSSSTINLDKVEDSGFTKVQVITSGIDTDNQLTQSIYYSLPDVTYQRNKAGFDKLFKELTPEGGKFTPPTADVDAWTITFPASSVDDLKKKTDTALKSDSFQFSKKQEVDPRNPMKVNLNVTGAADCTAICKKGYYQSKIDADFYVEMPQSYDEHHSVEKIHDKTVVRLYDGTSPVVLSKSAAIKSVDVQVAPRAEGGGKVTYRYVFSKADYAAVKEGITKALAPAEGSGSFTVEESGDDQVGIATIEANDAAQLNDRLAEYVGEGAEVVMAQTESSLFNKKHSLKVNIWLPQGVTNSVSSNPPTTITIVPPGGMKWVGAPSGATMDGDKAVVKQAQLRGASVRGVLEEGNLTGWFVVGGVVLGVAALAAGIAFLLRRNNKRGSDQPLAAQQPAQDWEQNAQPGPWGHSSASSAGSPWSATPPSSQQSAPPPSSQQSAPPPGWSQSPDQGPPPQGQ